MLRFREAEPPTVDARVDLGNDTGQFTHHISPDIDLVSEKGHCGFEIG